MQLSNDFHFKQWDERGNKLMSLFRSRPIWHATVTAPLKDSVSYPAASKRIKTIDAKQWLKCTFWYFFYHFWHLNVVLACPWNQRDLISIHTWSRALMRVFFLFFFFHLDRHWYEPISTNTLEWVHYAYKCLKVLHWSS